jgi:DNA-directed RNA polymerase subunit omega
MPQQISFDANEIIWRSQKLIDTASSRYRITTQVARRAKRLREEHFDRDDEPTMKPVIRAVIEMSDELSEPEIIVSD